MVLFSNLDKKMKKLVVKVPSKDNVDSFTECANAYYKKRLHLLGLLQNCMATISHWKIAIAALAKNHYRQNSFPTPSSHFDHDNDDQFNKEENNGSDIVDSYVETSLSYQPQFPSTQAKFEVDMIIADLMVIRSVDYEIILHELSQVR